MPGYSAIEEVGEVLVEVLEAGLIDISVDESQINVTLASPGELSTTTDVHLSVYLYRVEENSHLKNERREIDPASNKATQPPLTLELYYLLTAHLTSDPPDSTDVHEQHRILGRSMQILHENTVFRGAQHSGEDLRVTLHPQSTDEVMNLWNTFQETPYQPSVSYLVTPVVIERLRDEEVRRVAELQFKEHVRTDEEPKDD